MSGMFYGCEALTVLDLSNFNITNVMDINEIFDGCNAEIIGKEMFLTHEKDISSLPDVLY